MAQLDFENFSFSKKDDTVHVTYAERYFFTVPLEDFSKIDDAVEFHGKQLIFPNAKESVADRKVDQLIDRGLHAMTHKINKKDVVYIDEESGIPLIGSGEFGVIDRNTSLLEVKTHTGCNFNCNYCSVDEGVNKKTADILIDPYYMAQVCAELAARKTHPVEFNLGPHGEPLLYPFTRELVAELSEIPNCSVISVNTNGSFLSRKLIDELKEAGLTRINLSLNTLDQDIHNKLAGRPYPLKHVLKMVEYCKEIGMPILIAPTIIPNFNDSVKRDIEPLIQLAKTIKSPFPTIGIQKFLEYKGGRNPSEAIPFEDFFAMLRPLEEKYDVVLTPKADWNPFGIYIDTKLEKPFKKGDVIKVTIKAVGRVPSEKIAVAENRIVTVRNCYKAIGTSTKVKLIRDKHNIFNAIDMKG
jgi:uncharacterized Fe-S cluster-containing radical SAM superfamily enzyme